MNNAHGEALAVIDTRVIYCRDNLDQLRKVPEGCVDLIYIDPPFQLEPELRSLLGETKALRCAGAPLVQRTIKGATTTTVRLANTGHRPIPSNHRLHGQDT
ncbi:MAG: hypothetical protein H0X73_06720 [Chthoniobacterales bacterium]|nr:hypothetical protein [Chthoniobacterales bacterium]